MKDIEKISIENSALVVGAGTSKIWQSIAGLLMSTFDVIKTSKDSLDATRLNILDVKSIKNFISNYLEKYWDKLLNVVFLNSGFLNTGDTMNRFNFYRRANEGDPSINTHLNNVLLLERLTMAKIINPDTKVIYNASVQVLQPKTWYEDYAFIKKLVSNLILNDERRNPTILCVSLVEWTSMEQTFKENMNEDNFQKYVEKNMPYWQPTLDDVNKVVDQILSQKEETRWKLVLLDWWIVEKNNPDLLTDDVLLYDKESWKLMGYK